MRKIALITGGTSGLGLQLVEDYLATGYMVISVSRSQDKIEKAVDHFTNNNVKFICGDVSDENTLDEVFNYIQNEYGMLDVLINNAGIIYAGGIETLECDDWYKMLEVNVTALFKITKKVLPLLKKSADGNIVNISSISSKMTGSSIAYSTCKAAVDMMTQSLAKELAKYKIRVNSVNPGMINTGFQVSNKLIEGSEYNSFLEKIEPTYPLGIGTAKDISNMVVFITSDKAKWITGSNYIVDGGRSVNI